MPFTCLTCTQLLPWAHRFGCEQWLDGRFQAALGEGEGVMSSSAVCVTRVNTCNVPPINSPGVLHRHSHRHSHSHAQSRPNGVTSGDCNGEPAASGRRYEAGGVVRHLAG
jgi:hypothetical protein